MKWLEKTIARERRALERARRRFICAPNEKHLHQVRTKGRRFRSLLEDFATLAPSGRLRRRVKRAAAVTNAARDTTIIRRLLEKSVDPNEVEIARPLLEQLREARKTRDAVRSQGAAPHAFRSITVDMKPRRIDLAGVNDVRELVTRVVQTRLREARDLAAALEQRQMQELHDFRIACKRLRYGLERFGELEPSLDEMAGRLALMQSALGETHDRDVLLAILPPMMAATERRLQTEREQCVDRAAALWAELDPLIERSTLTRSQ